jgi:hypothetical protein
VQDFPQVLQSVLAVGRDVYASGPEWASLFTEGNRMLQDLLTTQRTARDDINKDLPAVILQTGQDTVAELKRGFNRLSEDLQHVQRELRRIQVV